MDDDPATDRRSTHDYKGIGFILIILISFASVTYLTATKCIAAEDSKSIVGMILTGVFGFIVGRNTWKKERPAKPRTATARATV